jgi:hypothetical protein
MLRELNIEEVIWCTMKQNGLYLTHQERLNQELAGFARGNL